jgi:hypothetical protein
MTIRPIAERRLIVLAVFVTSAEMPAARPNRSVVAIMV